MVQPPRRRFAAAALIALAALLSVGGAGCASTEALRGLPPFFELGAQPAGYDTSDVVLRPFFLTISRELEAAAKIDGCNQFDAFWRVILPLVRPGLITVAVFAFLMGWGEFLFAMTLSTNETVQPATAALNKFIGQYGTQWNNLMAVATTVAFPIIVVFALLQRYIVRGVMLSGLKG